MKPQPPPEASTLQQAELRPPSHPKQHSSIRNLRPSQQTQFPRDQAAARRPPTPHPWQENLPRSHVARFLLKQLKQLKQPRQPEQQSSATDPQLPRATQCQRKPLLSLLRASSPPSNLRHVQPPQAARFQHTALRPQGHSQELSSRWNLQPSLAARCRHKPRCQLKLLAPQSNLKHLQPPKAAPFCQKQLTRLQPLRRRSSLSDLQPSQPAQGPQKQPELLRPPTPQLSLRSPRPPHVAQCRHRQLGQAGRHPGFPLRHLQSSQPPQVHQKPL